MAANQRHSDVVRARRSQRQPSKRGSRSKRSTTGRQMPPMVTRNTMGTPRSAAQMRSKKEARRRYDIALGAAGSEVRLPVVGLPRLSWRVLSFVLLLGFSYLFFFLWTSPQFTVSEETVTVNGLHRVSEADLLAVSGILDKPVFLVNTTELAEYLENQVPALELAEVSVSLTGEVLINVVERVPVIVWDQSDIDQVWWVDMYGMRFKALGGSEGLIHVQADVPPPQPPALEDAEESAETQPEDAALVEVSTAEDSGQLMAPELVAGIMEVPAYMPAGAELIYDEVRGIGWKDPDHNWTVFFGKKLDQMPLRLKIYQAIMDYLSDKNNQPVLISVEYIHSPYYRMEP